jgi:RimJ/RimL family protein N-acetyltransferase
MDNIVYIRPLQESDALISYHWRNDPEIWKYTGHRPDRIITPEIELNWIKQVLSNPTTKRFAICLREDNKYIGNVQLTDINNGVAHFHIFIGEKQCWGKGIATQATRLLIEYAKNELCLKELYLWVNEKNKAAIQVYLKCGFVFYDKTTNMVLHLS